MGKHSRRVHAPYWYGCIEKLYLSSLPLATKLMYPSINERVDDARHVEVAAYGGI